MSLTKEAIQYIENTSKVGEVIEGADFPAIILSNETQAVTLENMQKFRNRFRASMSTSSIGGFADYISDFSESSEVSCFISGRSPRAVAVFNAGTIDKPGHADNTATLELLETAEYVKLRDVNGDNFSQKGLAEFIEDYQFNIKIIDTDGKDMPATKAAAVIRNMEINAAATLQSEVNQFSENKTASEMIEAKAKAGGPQPAWINFLCKPYQDLNTKAFPLRISVITGKDSIKFSIRVAKFEVLKQEIIEEFKAIVGESINSDNIYIGEFKAI